MDRKNIIIIVLILLTIIVCALLTIEKSKTNKSAETIGYTYLILQPDSTMDKELNAVKQVVTFDKNDICVDCRFLYDFKDITRAQEQYDIYISNNKPNEQPNLTNIQINNSKVSFNSKDLIGTPKSEFLAEDSANKYDEI